MSGLNQPNVPSDFFLSPECPYCRFDARYPSTRPTISPSQRFSGMSLESVRAHMWSKHVLEHIPEGNIRSIHPCMISPLGAATPEPRAPIVPAREVGWAELTMVDGPEWLSLPDPQVLARDRLQPPTREEVRAFIFRNKPQREPEPEPEPQPQPQPQPQAQPQAQPQPQFQTQPQFPTQSQFPPQSQFPSQSQFPPRAQFLPPLRLPPQPQYTQQPHTLAQRGPEQDERIPQGNENAAAQTPRGRDPNTQMLRPQRKGRLLGRNYGSS